MDKQNVIHNEQVLSTKYGNKAKQKGLLPSYQVRWPDHKGKYQNLSYLIFSRWTSKQQIEMARFQR